MSRFVRFGKRMQNALDGLEDFIRTEGLDQPIFLEEEAGSQQLISQETARRDAALLGFMKGSVLPNVDTIRHDTQANLNNYSQSMIHLYHHVNRAVGNALHRFQDTRTTLSQHGYRISWELKDRSRVDDLLPTSAFQTERELYDRINRQANGRRKGASPLTASNVVAWPTLTDPLIAAYFRFKSTTSLVDKILRMLIDPGYIKRPINDIFGARIITDEQYLVMIGESVMEEMREHPLMKWREIGINEGKTEADIYKPEPHEESLFPIPSFRDGTSRDVLAGHAMSKLTFEMSRDEMDRVETQVMTPEGAALDAKDHPHYVRKRRNDLLELARTRGLTKSVPQFGAVLGYAFTPSADERRFRDLVRFPDPRMEWLYRGSL